MQPQPYPYANPTVQSSYGRKPSGTFAAGKPQASAEAAQAAEDAEP